MSEVEAVDRQTKEGSYRRRSYSTAILKNDVVNILDIEIA